VDVGETLVSGQTTELVSTPPEPKGSLPSLRAPEPETTRRRYLWTVVVVAVVAAVAAIVFSILPRSQAPASPVGGGAVRTVAAARGNFVDTLRLTGTTEAVTSFPIVAPRLAGVPGGGSLTIIRLRQNGAHVKRGDLLVEFDRQNEIKNYLDNRAKWMDLANQVAKQKATEGVNRAKDETDIQTAEDEVKTAQLEMQKLELLSRIDQEITRQQLQEAQASLKELQQTFKLKRAQGAAELRDLELQRDQAKRDMLHAQRNEELMAIHSPINGVAVLHTIWKSGNFGTVTEGDQVRPGTGFMEVVDPSEMEVMAKASQMDVAKLHVGQQAEVRLDAYPDLVFQAKLESISPIGVKGQFASTVHNFSVLFSVNKGDPRLMPDLSAAVDVTLGQQKGAVLVPNDCVARGEGHSFVYMRAGSSFRKQEVESGRQNSLMTVIKSGLKAGDVVRRGVSKG
jgi:HlyD family secretion protein